MSPLEAHRRLLEKLLVRTHELRDGPPPPPPKKPGKHPKHARAVVAFGKKYASLAEAARALGKSRQFIHQRVKRNDECWYA